MSTMRIAFLHLAPCLRDLQANRRLIDRAVTMAAIYGATWILTPELCICKPNSTTFSASAPTAYTATDGNSMCDGLLSPTSITLSIRGKFARTTVRAPRRLAIDNQEKPAIVEGVDGPKVITPHMSSW